MSCTLSGKASLTCWRAKCCKIASWKSFYSLIHTAHKVSFRFDASTKKLFISCDYCILFACLSYKDLKQMLKILSYRSSNIQIKCIRKTSINLIKYSTLHETYFALKYNNRFLLWLLLPGNIILFFRSDCRKINMNFLVVNKKSVTT